MPHTRPQATRRSRHACAWLLACALGCSDQAFVGGVCPADCALGTCTSDDCSAACARPECNGGSDAGQDACAADGCKPGAGPSCREGAYELSRARLDLILVVDDAASLAPWWQALRDGLTTFLAQESSRGLGVGLQRFADVCEPQQYVQPIVPIAPLPENLAALQAALPVEATATTSTIPALEGVLQFARSWAVSHSDARVAVVLLTDTTPGACDALRGDFNALAPRFPLEAFEGSPSIATYVVGVSVFPLLDAIATAGGTQLRLISLVPDGEEVRAALDGIRAEAQACAFRWPQGWTLAPSSEVVVSTSNGAQSRYPILPSAAQCDREGGFYVADASAPYPLVACPDTCVRISTGQLTLSSACMTP